MKKLHFYILLFTSNLLILTLCACTTLSDQRATSSFSMEEAETISQQKTDYASRLPQHISTTEKLVVVDPRLHVWGAYDSSGNLLRAGIATAGAAWCQDLNRACRTRVGHFRIYSLGNASCKSSIFPLPRGGAPMPYCMFFNKGQALHGSSEVGEGNFSHGCVRLRMEDITWLRFNFVTPGTKIIIKPY